MAIDKLIHCRVTAVPGGHHVTVAGEIDLQTAQQLAETLLQFANGSVTVDLRDVTFMGSSGIHALLQAHTHITQRNAWFTITCTSAPVQRILDITGLTKILNIKEPTLRQQADSCLGRRRNARGE